MRTNSRAYNEVPEPPRSRCCPCAFTLIELLVVIATVATLAAFLLPAFANTGQSAIRIQCKNNERQQLLALTTYAEANGGSFPHNMQGFWCWDMDASLANKLIASGTTPQSWYDPGTAPRFGPVDWFGTVPYGSVPGGGNSLWIFQAPYPDPNPEPGQIRVIGYAQTVYGTAGYSDVSATNTNLKLSATSTPGYFNDVNGVPVGPLSQRPLVACATLTVSGDSDVYATMITYNWTQIAGGYMYNGVYKPHLSAHMKNATIPDGGNIGMIDGHVEWRPFSQMINRTLSGPYFYY